MRIAYLHYLYGDDTALHHVRQFAAAAAALGHQIEVHAINLAPPPPAPSLAPSRSRAWAPAPGAVAADGAEEGAATAGRREPAPSVTHRLRWATRQRLGRYLHEPKELMWNALYVHHELALLGAGPRPDVLLVRDHALTASTAIVASRLGLPLVYEINAPAVELALYFDEHLHLPLVAGWLEGFKLRRADAVTTVSTALREHLVARHRLRGWAADKIVVVPNGADVAAFRPDNQPSALARRLLGRCVGQSSGAKWAENPGNGRGAAELGCEAETVGAAVVGRAHEMGSGERGRGAAALAPAGERGNGAGPGNGAGEAVVGFVGSFQKFHGVDLLADMALRVAALRPRVRFLLVGDGPGAAAAWQRLAPLGERLATTGAVPHAAVPGLVAAFDIGVLPETSFYACPLKVIEWMAAGKAVVAPRYGPLCEVLADGEEGLLFPPRDLGALVAAVLRLVDRPALRRRLGEAAAARAGASLAWTDNARRVVSVLEQARGRALVAGRAQPEWSPGSPGPLG
ncbi:MAG: glycosyltransferase [Acidobacteria bacterium]|nr:glycosyltransferase [Acidobacteriota bacterium]